ncbi:growth-regulated alpha protein-like [Cyanistes caeruleus]|uniref:growth-regulated alpha protein-like n=1 Tax=Cyanistes caeruleus TaxID=156563 RepID=UPI000CDAA764|nr:growth-regulated alpha protein-like [Cyanistes caeruleus]
MNPRLRILLLLAAAALCQGAPLAGELRCRCPRTVSEVIATTKQGHMVCLNPAAAWVKLLVTRILRSSPNKL